MANNGTYLNFNGNWSSGSNWSGSAIADGANYTASFNYNNPTNSSFYVNLDTSRQLGSIYVSNSGNVTIKSTNSSLLTLSSSGNSQLNILTPTFIDAKLADSTTTSAFDTVEKLGPGNLYLRGDNTALKGYFNITSGNVIATSSTSLGTTASVIISLGMFGTTTDYSSINIQGGSLLLSGTSNFEITKDVIINDASLASSEYNILNILGFNTLSNVGIQKNSRIGAESSTTLGIGNLTLSGGSTAYIAGDGEVQLTTDILGTGNIVYTGTYNSNLYLTATNSLIGDVYVVGDGSLYFEKTNSLKNASNLYFDSIAGVSTSTVRYIANSTDAPVFLNPVTVHQKVSTVQAFGNSVYFTSDSTTAPTVSYKLYSNCIIDVQDTTLRIAAPIVESNSSFNYSLTKIGPGVLDLFTVGNVVNTFSGGLTISEGTLKVNRPNSFGYNSNITLSGGTLLLSRDSDFSALPTTFNVRKSSQFTSDTQTANIYSTINHSLGPVYIYKTTISDIVSPTTLTVSKGLNVSETGKIYLEPLFLDSGNNTILNILSNAILEVNNFITPIYSSDTFNLTKDGPGELLLTLPDGSNQQSDTYFKGGTVTISRDVHLGDTKGNLYFYNDSLLKLTSDSLTIAASRITNIASTGGGFAVVLTASYGGTIVGSGTFRKTLSGTLNLSGKNTPGSFNVEAGILNINSGTSLLANCNINAGATVNYNSSSYTRSHSFSGAGVFNQKSTGTLTLTGNSSSFNGTVNVDSGVLKTEQPNSIGSSALNLVGGNLNISYISSSSEYGLATGTFKNSVGRKITFS